MRLIIEAKELNERIYRLEKYAKSGYPNANRKQIEIMSSQRMLMTSYLKCLMDRLDNFGVSNMDVVSFDIPKTYMREELVLAYQKWVENWKANPDKFTDWDKITNSRKDAEESVDYMILLIEEK